MKIQIKSGAELEAMRVSGRMTAEVLEALCAMTRAGMTTGELDAEARRRIAAMGAKPAFLNYHGFPAAACISVNDEVIHGIPGDRVIQNGDLVSIDIGVKYKGFIGDSAYTVMVGDRFAPDALELVRATQAALADGIAQVRPGARLSDVSHAIQQTAEGAGCSIVVDYVGHGVGRDLHEDPQIPNHGRPGKGPVLKAGMTLAIEPMVNRGSAAVRVLDDGWTVVTQDGKPSAHFEHTVAVTEDGAEILTAWK